MSTNMPLWIFFLILLATIGICIFLGFSFSEQIIFDPAKAINDAIDFFLGLLAMIISFWIAEIYWSRKNDNIQFKHVRLQLEYYLKGIGKIVYETNSALAEFYTSNEFEKSGRRDQIVLTNLRRLYDSLKNIEYVLDHSNSTLIKFIRGSEIISLFQDRIAPDLRELSKITQLRPETEHTGSTLTRVGLEISNLIEML